MQEKNSESLRDGTDKTDKTPCSEVSSVLSVRNSSESENFASSAALVRECLETFGPAAARQLGEKLGVEFDLECRTMIESKKNYKSARGETPKTPKTSKPITLQQAAGIAGVSPDTVARWCKRYGIGKQLHPKAPWRVDPLGLAVVAAGDSEALTAYQAGDQEHLQILPYVTKSGDWGKGPHR